MTLVEENATDNSFDGLVNGSVIKNDVGAFSAQFESQSGIAASQGSGNIASHRGGARERNFVDVRVRHERSPGGTSTGDDVHNTGRKLGLLTDFSKQQRRERRCFCGFQHNRISCSQCRRNLPGQHQ